MRVTPVFDANYLPTLEKILQKARTSVDVLAFSFAIGSSSGVLARNSKPFELAEKLIALKRARGRGFKIRLYIEGYRETESRNRITAEYLRRHGIEVRYGQTHAKGICIDKRVVLFGSTNFTNQSMTRNREVNVLIDDTMAAKEFMRYFDFMWTGGTHGGIHLQPPFYADGDFAPVLLELIARAKRRLDFSIYFFHVTQIEKALAAAAARGVKVRGVFGSHASFALSYVRRTRGTAYRLRESGVQDLFFGSPSSFTHCKFIVRDGREALLGTGNWLHEDVKIHPQLYFRSESAPFARKLLAYLDRVIAEEGRPVRTSPRSRPTSRLLK